jgi:hypothetical protein
VWRGQRSPGGASPPGFGPRRWSAEPSQVEKAGFQERKGLTSAHVRTQERGKTPQFSAAPAQVHSSHAAHKATWAVACILATRPRRAGPALNSNSAVCKLRWHRGRGEVDARA